MDVHHKKCISIFMCKDMQCSVSIHQSSLKVRHMSSKVHTSTAKYTQVHTYVRMYTCTHRYSKLEVRHMSDHIENVSKVHTSTYVRTYVHMYLSMHTYTKAHSKSVTCLHIQRMSASASESTIWKALCVRCFLTICSSENTLIGLLAPTAAGPLGVEAGSGHCSLRRT